MIYEEMVAYIIGRIPEDQELIIRDRMIDEELILIYSHGFGDLMRCKIIRIYHIALQQIWI
jgi:hypothetical protein